MSKGQELEIIVNDVFEPFLRNESRFEILYGGAGSGKSVFVAQKKVLQHIECGQRKTLVVRKVAKTIRNSCYAEILDVINELGISHIFKCNKSDLEIIGPHGSKILFAGLDDVEKLKSIQGITDVWIEEASEITESDFEQLNLRLRGITPISKQITLTFNPISALSWIKKYFFDTEKENCNILKTTYHDNAFLDDDYIREIESLKERDPIYYKIYGLGEWGVLGSLVYTNYIVKDIPTDPREYKTVYNGMDWGFNDPSAIIRVGVRDTELYVFDGVYRRGLDNSELMELSLSIIEKNDRITADSSEPARIKEWRRNGFKVVAAKKGRDSVRFGIDFIRRHKVYIHPQMQDFINEIQGYHYKEDKDGNVTEEPVDVRNHYMDAMRYALEDLASKKGMVWA